jgi:hypothetical protein
MIVWAVADRALDIIGLGTVIYWTVKLTIRVTRGKSKAPARPRAERL